MQEMNLYMNFLMDIYIKNNLINDNICEYTYIIWNI